LDKRRSLIGYIFIVDDCIVSWRVTSQLVVAQYINEAEHMGIAESM
jgi:hypothetical protein